MSLSCCDTRIEVSYRNVSVLLDRDKGKEERGVTDLGQGRGEVPAFPAFVVDQDVIVVGTSGEL